MGVGHNTTDEVGLSLVEGGHQVVELALEVGGHGLAALALLPVLVLGSLERLAGGIRKALEEEREIFKQLNKRKEKTDDKGKALIQKKCF